MKCPNCGEREELTIDKADGYSASESPVKECGSCHHVWRIKPGGDGQIDIIQQGVMPSGPLSKNTAAQ